MRSQLLRCGKNKKNPLTGMEVGISLRVYSLLFAKGCRPSSSHTDWEEDSRLTKDRKDWRGQRDKDSRVGESINREKKTTCAIIKQCFRNTCYGTGYEIYKSSLWHWPNDAHRYKYNPLNKVQELKENRLNYPVDVELHCVFCP